MAIEQCRLDGTVLADPFRRSCYQSRGIDHVMSYKIAALSAYCAKKFMPRLSPGCTKATPHESIELSLWVIIHGLSG